MGYTSDYVLIDGTKVKIASGTRGAGTVGKSQTVNIYDDSNTEGSYREVYRSYEHKNWVATAQIKRECRTLQSLDSCLLARGFKKEGPRRKS